MMSYIARDGTKDTYPISVEETGKIIAGMSPEDGRELVQVRGVFPRDDRDLMSGFFVSPANDIADMVKMVAKIPALLKYVPMFVKSYQDVLKGYFKTRRCSETMGYQSLYLGLPPELVAGLFALLIYSEHEGIWYPRGGWCRYRSRSGGAARGYGMEVQTGSRVASQVIVRNREACGRRARRRHRDHPRASSCRT